MHANLQLTARASVSAGVMRYRYDFAVRSDARGSATPLASLLGLNAIPVGVWRDEALIDRSYRIGGNYRLQRATLGAQYFRDRGTRSAATSSTWQLQAEVPLGEHWMLAPMLGYSSGAGFDAMGYGGVNLRLSW